MLALLVVGTVNADVEVWLKKNFSNKQLASIK